MPKKADLWYASAKKKSGRDAHIETNTTAPEDSDRSALSATLGGPARRPSSPGYGVDSKAHAERRKGYKTPETKWGGDKLDGGQMPNHVGLTEDNH